MTIELEIEGRTETKLIELARVPHAGDYVLADGMMLIVYAVVWRTNNITPLLRCAVWKKNPE